MPSWEVGGVHSNNNEDDVIARDDDCKDDDETQMCNNQPCGRMHFRRRGEGVISKTTTASKTTRTSHDKDKDYNQGGSGFQI